MMERRQRPRRPAPPPHRCAPAARSSCPPTRAFTEVLGGLGQPGRVDHDGLHPPAAEPGPRRGLRAAGRADHPRRGPHLRHGRAVPRDQDLRRPGPEVRAGRRTTCCSPTPSPRTARSSRRASPRPAPCPASSPPAPATPPAACRWCPSTSSIRCSASSGSATSSGRPPTPGPAGSCSAPPPGAPRCSARACSTRTATAWCWPRPCRRARPTTRPSPTRWRPSSSTASERMYGPQPEDVFYYLTLYNENYPMPAMPERRRGGRSSTACTAGPRRPTGRRSGPPCCSRARRRAPPARPPTSWPSTTTSASSCGRPRLQGAAGRGAGDRALEPPAPRPGAAGPARRAGCWPTSPGPIVAVTDFMKIVPEQVARFLPDRLFIPLGTDGFGRSDTREALRRFFEVDAGHVVVAVLSGAGRAGRGQGGGRGRRHRPLRHRSRGRQPGRRLTRRSPPAAAA